MMFAKVPPPDWLQGWSEILSAFLIVILTIFLVHLYRGQKELLAANHEPVLEISSYDWDDDEVTVYLSNWGNGLIKDLRLGTLVYDENGGHRTYTSRSRYMTRAEESNNSSFFGDKPPRYLRPGEEQIPFTAESVIGKPFPGTSREHSGVSFSKFVLDMKESGSEEVKYVHFVAGNDLSRRERTAKFYIPTKAVNPQKFDRDNSLENLPSQKLLTNDQTFHSYFHPSRKRRLSEWLYLSTYTVLNSLIPNRKISPKPLDASGQQRVKK